MGVPQGTVPYLLGHSNTAWIAFKHEGAHKEAARGQRCQNLQCLGMSSLSTCLKHILAASVWSVFKVTDVVELSSGRGHCRERILDPGSCLWNAQSLLTPGILVR